MESQFALQPIGTIHSAITLTPGISGSSVAGQGFPDLADVDHELPFAPRIHAAGGIGTLEIVPEWEQFLRNLDGLSHIWILFWHHSGTETTRHQTQQALSGDRIPERPNPIGISSVRVLGIRGRFVHVAEMNALNGSPLLDIKPCNPQTGTRPAHAGRCHTILSIEK